MRELINGNGILDVTNGALRLNNVFHFLFYWGNIPAMLIVYILIHAFNVDVYLSAAQGPFILVLIVFTLSILYYTILYYQYYYLHIYYHIYLVHLMEIFQIYLVTK